MTLPLQPGKQVRSRATQDRILQATARLLKKETFDRISVRRIVAEAETSTGSFYARFRDKNGLLAVLYADYEEKLESRIAELREAVEAAKSITDVCQLVAAHVVSTYGENPNLSRALFEHSTQDPKSTEAIGVSKRRERQYRFLIDVLASFEDEITHPDAKRAAQLGLYFLAVVCRNRLFYPLLPQSRTIKLSKRDLEAEVATMLVRYLCG